MHLSRKTGVLSAAVGLTLATGVVGASLAMAASSHAGTNGFPGVSSAPTTAGSCGIYNDSGSTVTSITIDTVSGSDQVFWLHYSPPSGSSATQVTFKVTSKSSSNPLASLTEKFRRGGTIETPFGIPYWSGALTTGSYKLSASDNDGGHATCTFTAS
jgi:hypothetical protein